MGDIAWLLLALLSPVSQTGPQNSQACVLEETDPILLALGLNLK